MELDIREVGWWARKAEEVWIERKIERLSEMRLAQHGDEQFKDVCEDLEMRLMIIRQKPVDEFVKDSRPQFREFANQLKGAFAPLSKEQIAIMVEKKKAEMSRTGG